MRNHSILLSILLLSMLQCPARSEELREQDVPALYGFCMEISDAKKRTIAEQVEMLAELDFEGVGYPLWLDGQMEKNLAAIDKAGLDAAVFYTRVNLKPGATAYDPLVAGAMEKLKGRGATICLLMQGLPAGDPRGMEPAVKVLRELGDVAQRCDLQVSIYHHTGDWTERLPHAIEVIKKADHPRVGVNFNLCHWLKIEGERDYRPVLREAADKLFAVTINGAKRGTTTWTDGLIQPLDKGDFNNPALLKFLEEIGYDGPIGLMCYGIKGDAREHLGRSMDVWKDWYSSREGY